MGLRLRMSLADYQLSKADHLTISTNYLDQLIKSSITKASGVTKVGNPLKNLKVE
jgi:hypothetical protein